ncbi:DUF6875 domain-containing protein [Streptomyces sp. NPDC051582]|uniref:DUF6875 domain-containing protein n=1 Tax=Streptomyces sp. NPDC051582 TaxID=3155167 RepID=UPI0034340171
MTGRSASTKSSPPPSTSTPATTPTPSSVRSDPGRTPRPLGGSPGAATCAETWRALHEWVLQYLCRPHPQLGRPGAVCPYTRRALETGRLHVLVWPWPVPDTQALTEIMNKWADWFERVCGDDDGQALLVAFPALPRPSARRLIEGAQLLLKTPLAQRGLMVGEFHDGPPPAHGVRNPGFRPFHSPVPLLALRRMIRPDLVFLRDDRAQHAAYRTRFPDSAVDNPLEPVPALNL